MLIHTAPRDNRFLVGSEPSEPIADTSKLFFDTSNPIKLLWYYFSPPK
jgi:hypothetical protein